MPADMNVKVKGTCFVVMGFNKKTDFESGRTFDLDKSYYNMIKPAVEAAGLTCVRADEVVHSGLIDAPMYDQLLNADVVVADLSTSNKNAFYELGVRHALRPWTTIAIAEDGLKFPFDVNHIVVRQYHHLGEDIGFDEAMRFRKLLTDTIVDILKQQPRPDDSPVYAFLTGLNPPTLGAPSGGAVTPLMVVAQAGKVEAQAAVPARPASTTDVPSTHSALMQQVSEAQRKGDFVTAKSLLAFARGMMKAEAPERSEDPYMLQRLALVTYKSKHPSEEAALVEARDLLKALSPETSNDTETLGLWGSVHKRLWELTKDAAQLDQAVRAYERGFFIRNDPYNGINLAFLYNVRAANATDNAEAIADFVQARRVRKEVLALCQQWLDSNPAPNDADANSAAVQQDAIARYWTLATMAEAWIGIGAEKQGEQLLQGPHALAPEPWMQDTTRQQLHKLKLLLADSPLKHIAPGAA